MFEQFLQFNPPRFLSIFFIILIILYLIPQYVADQPWKRKGKKKLSNGMQVIDCGWLLCSELNESAWPGICPVHRKG